MMRFYVQFLICAASLVGVLPTARAQVESSSSDGNRTYVVSIASAQEKRSPVEATFCSDVCRADTSQQISTWEVKGWRNYQRLWNEFAKDPGNLALRKYLGLPIGSAGNQSVVIKVARGRSAPKWLGWRPGSYQQVDTPHLQIFSRASLGGK